MSQFAWIAVWMGIGLALRRAGAGREVLGGLNRLIVWGPLPATVLFALHGLQWEAADWIPVSMAWLMFAAGTALFVAAGRLRGWKAGAVGALVMTGGLGNTSFVGFPLLRALYGERAIPVAVLADQPGSFLVLTTVGLAAAAYFSSGRPSLSAVVRRMARFPPLWALFAAVALRPVAFPAAVDAVLRLGMRALIPLALISVGAQLRFQRALLTRERVPLALGLAYKLVLAPALMTLLFVVLMGRRGEAVRITILEAAMGPMITGAIVADEHGLDPELSSLMISVGVPLCLVTVPLWAKLLSLVGV